MKTIGLQWSALCVLLIAGCGPSQYPVRGKVVYADGTPMDGGMVNFEKAEGEAKYTADGPVAADGTFELRTTRPGDGVQPGKYKVLVRAKEWTLAESRKKIVRIHPKFESFETSGIELTVEPRANFFEIKVTKP